MVRIGGPAQPWKNSEDEVLKAAVMKYGTQAWGRISSLFARRTAKQCKARWTEWLSPLIKKTEWSREEDEKLLHMVKLMPSQWRTIAPLVGRTAAQCIERYEQLIDEANGEATHSSSRPTDRDGEDPTKARPGARPLEARVARPDAVDMDEEELEMLSEAKARLANTLGKKAKRKARERQLEEMRRVAAIQKNRELKAAAGVRSASSANPLQRRHRRKNSDAEEIDYTAEVPFELQAPAGPHDVRAEVAESQRRAQDVQARILNLQRLSKEQEEARKRQRLEESKARGETAAAVAKALEDSRRAAAESLAASRALRPKLLVPEPTVSEAELAQIAKLVGSVIPAAAAASLAAGSAAGAPGAPTPAVNVALEEARNQLTRSNAANPLLGGERPQVFGEGTGFRGAAPRSSAQAAASSSSVRPALATVASRRTFVGASGRVSVIRDSLGINRGVSAAASVAGGDAASAVATEDDVPDDADELALQADERVRAALAQLPRPEYRVVLDAGGGHPGGDAGAAAAAAVAAAAAAEEQGDGGAGLAADAAERDRARARAEERRRQLKLEQRPTPVRRGLPMPPRANAAKVSGVRVQVGGDFPTADRLIASELARVLAGDGPCVDDATWDGLRAKLDMPSDALLGEACDVVMAGDVWRARDAEFASDGGGVERAAQVRERYFAASKAVPEVESRASALQASVQARLEAVVGKAAAAKKRAEAARRELAVARGDRDAFSDLLAREVSEGPLRLQRAREDLDALLAEEKRLQRLWSASA